jgi:L-alanine-DL-glutamate epimerase-like enolase superfamily enzyme
LSSRTISQGQRGGVDVCRPEAEGELIEYSQSDGPLFRDLVKNLIPLDNGRVRVPDSPGLGVVLYEDVLERYRVDERQSG